MGQKKLDCRTLWKVYPEVFRGKIHNLLMAIILEKGKYINNQPQMDM